MSDDVTRFAWFDEWCKVLQEAELNGDVIEPRIVRFILDDYAALQQQLKQAQLELVSMDARREAAHEAFLEELDKREHAEARVRELEQERIICDGTMTHIEPEHLTELIAAEAKLVAAEKLTNENGSYKQIVYDQILIPGRCGVSGHFQFQENGLSCLMCQQTESIQQRLTRLEAAVRNVNDWLDGSNGWPAFDGDALFRQVQHALAPEEPD